MNHNTGMSCRYRTMRSGFKHWSQREQIVLFNCLENLGRYTFTTEDFVLISQMLQTEHNIDRTPQQCAHKYKELKRAHPNPQVCDFFKRLRRRESMDSIHESLLCHSLNKTNDPGDVKHPFDMLQMEMSDGESGTSNGTVDCFPPNLIRTPKIEAGTSNGTVDCFPPNLIRTPKIEAGTSKAAASSPTTATGTTSDSHSTPSTPQANSKDTPAKTPQKDPEEYTVYSDDSSSSSEEMEESTDNDQDVQVISVAQKPSKHQSPNVKKEAADTSGGSSCPKCKAAINKDDKFCSECGCKVSLCLECWVEVKPSANFCGSCGAKQNKV